MNLCSEFADKTEDIVAPHEKTFAICLFIDEDTKMKTERKGLVEGESPFEMVCDLLEMLSSDEHNKKAPADYL